MIKRYILYLLRWQLSTPILASSMVFFHFGVTWNTILANLIGGLIFFWVDRYIFTSNTLAPHWEVVEDTTCFDCNLQVKRGYYLVRSAKYDRSGSIPEYRCENCSHKQSMKLKESGVESYTRV